MARYNRGWIKLYRKAIAGDIASDPHRLLIFIYLVAWANYKESWVEWRGEPVKLPRGSLVSSYTELGDAVGCDKNTAKRHVKYLEKRQSICLDTSPKGIRVTVLNYEDYQGYDAEDSHELPVSLTAASPQPPANLTHRKKVINKESNNLSVHPGEIQNWLMGKEAKSFSDYIEEMFKPLVPGNVKRNLYWLAKGFDFDLDKLALWNSRYCSTSSYKQKVKEDNPGRVNEKAGALLVEVGVFEGRRGPYATA